MKFKFQEDPPEGKAGATIGIPTGNPTAKAGASAGEPSTFDKVMEYSERGGLFKFLYDQSKDEPLPELNKEQATEALDKLKKLKIGRDIDMDTYYTKRKWLEGILGAP